uniref:DUF4408 domain-containing protein n=1 Tax=Leersia perrieri TaxID=77586 RepID=A0A0D9VW24_9ORYZ
MQIEFNDLKHCNPGSVRIRSSGGVSQVAFIFAAIGFISLVSPSSMQYTSLSSTLSAQLLAAGSFVMNKKALFVLSNAIFLFLAADYYRYFFRLSPFTSEFTSCGHSGVIDKQDQHDHQVGVEPSVTESCVPHSEIHYRDNDDAPEDYPHDERRDVESSMRNVRTPDHEDIAMSSQPELNSLEMVVVEEPTCGTAAQELEKLGIDELNKKFDEFIKSRRTKWEEEAYLQ